MANVIKHKRGSGSDPSASDLVVGEVAIRTDTGKLFTKMDNGSVAEIAGGGSDIAINTLSSSSGTGGGSATFNGSAYRFTLSSPPSVSAQQLLVSINGVIQKPVAGTGQPSEGFSVDGNDIILGDAPATGADFFIVTFKSLGVSEPADNSVTSAKIADGAIVNADINASAAIQGTKVSPNFGSQNIVTTGNAAIGTTSASLPLTVVGANNTTFDHVGTISLQGTDAYNSGNAGAGINFSGKFNSSNLVTTLAQISGIKEDTGDGTYDGALTFGVRNDAQGVTIERARISSSGDFGIGTTSPEDLLHIKSGKIRIENAIVSNNDSTISYDNSDFLIDVDPNNVRGSSQFQIKIDTVAGLTIDDNRNVGIGTISPDGKLDVRGTIFVNGDGTGGRIFASSGNLSLSDGNGRQVLRIDDPGTGNSHSHIFDSNGRLGIGTATPTTRFTIVQSANNSTGGLSIFDSAASSSFRIFRTGAGAGSVVSLQDRGTDVINIKDQQVGIGTTSPRSLLDLGTNDDNENVSNTAAHYQLGLHAAQSTSGDIGRNIGFISNSVGTVTAAINSVDFGGSDATGLTFLTGNSTEIDRRMTIDQVGRVCIGINSAAGLNASSDDLVVGNYNVSTDRGITIGSNTNGSIRFADSGNGSAGILEYMHGSANLFKMHANTTASTTAVLGLVKTNAATNAQVTMITFEAGNQARGQIKSSSSDSGSPSFAAYSDYRMKENIRNYTGGWNNIKAVPVKLFDITTDGSKDQKGWIAHELQAVLPDLVQGAKDAVVTQAMVDNEESDEKELGNPIYQTVSMGLFMPDVISALQTAIAKIETLETKVAALEAG